MPRLAGDGCSERDTAGTWAGASELAVEQARAASSPWADQPAPGPTASVSIRHMGVRREVSWCTCSVSQSTPHFASGTVLQHWKRRKMQTIPVSCRVMKTFWSLLVPNCSWQKGGRGDLSHARDPSDARRIGQSSPTQM